MAQAEPMASPPRQLALALPHADDFSRDNFLVGPPNETAAALIDRWPDWPARIVVLCGPEGAGKSHLAAVWAQASGARRLAAWALDIGGVPGALATGALLIEDLSGEAIDDRAMFHLINLVAEQEAFVLITARSLPVTWVTTLPDLASRLRALPTVSLGAPDEPLLRALLVKLFADRQVSVDEALLDYLLPRIERSFAGARAAVHRLDGEALRQKRRISRAFAAELFRNGD